jgi:hypothetical protein
MNHILLLSSVAVLITLVVYGIYKTKEFHTASMSSPQYNITQQFKENETLQFPEFQISYIGQSYSKWPNNPDRNITNYNFEILSENKTMSTSWSAGLGEIAPAFFTAKSKVYQLELSRTGKDNLSLKDNEMVIAPASVTLTQYIFSLITRLTLLPKYDVESLTKSIGILFNQASSSDIAYDKYTSTGFDFISSAELDIKKSDALQKTLRLEIGESSSLTIKDIEEHYPSATINNKTLNDKVTESRTVAQPWGQIAFNFNNNHLVTEIVFNSIK